MLFVYWLEDHPQHSAKVQEILVKMEQRGDVLCTSVFTVGELLVAPKKRGVRNAAGRLKESFRASRIDLLPFTESTAERFAEVRASLRVTATDAIHLAAAADAGADLFLTNDRRLHGLIVPGIQFIADMGTDIL
jgi:predicted nucleic acid-binding protein